jgi:hypothetical protein
MKKIIIVLIALVTMNSCSDSDDTANTFDGDLITTVWLGTEDDEGESYTFLSNQDVKYVGEGTISSGTYTYSGTNGVFTFTSGTFAFKIVGTTMTVEDGSSSIFIKN